jgi:hypothetical protein
MNILIASSKLADVTRTAARSVPHQRDRKHPVLNCCRLTAGGNSLSICGTDLATGIQQTSHLLWKGRLDADKVGTLWVSTARRLLRQFAGSASKQIEAA